MRRSMLIPLPITTGLTLAACTAGVEEPDLVKTDGRRIVTVAPGTPRGRPAREQRSGASPGAEPWTLRVVDAASRQVTGMLPLPVGDLAPGWPYRGGVELLLSGD